MDNFMTIEDLREELDKMCRNDYGGMKVRCADGLLHMDEIGYNIAEGEMILRGNIFNIPAVKRVNEFRRGVNELYEKFRDSI